MSPYIFLLALLVGLSGSPGAVAAPDSAMTETINQGQDEKQAEEAVAEEPAVFTVTPESRFTAVKGDIEKYRSLSWRKDGYVYGFKNINYTKDINKETHFNFSGSVFPQENDAQAEFGIAREEFGYLKGKYQSFTKYFDGTGGVYRSFTTLRVNELDPDLEMNVGFLDVEVGTDPEQESGLSFQYERHVKDGKKSRLAWTAVKEGATTRSIGPSWQDVDETSDSLALKGRTMLANFKLSGEQKWEFFRATSLREERSLATTGVAADTKIRRQDQEPKTDLMSSSLRGERWFNEDKSFLGLGYRYSLLRNDELEFLKEFTAAGIPVSYSNPKNKFNATAENEMDQHAWNGHYTLMPLPDLNVITKVKAELISKRGNSIYPSETTNPPDGINNTVEVSDTKSRVYQFGENFGLRYSGIPKVSLYSEVDLSQARNTLYESRNSLAGQSSPEDGEIFGRDTLTHVYRNVGVVGGRYVPVGWLNINAHYKHKDENNDYDDRKETNPGGSTARSAFFDALRLQSDEVSSKVGWKPFSWLQTSARYQFLNNRYYPRVENELETLSRVLAHVMTYDFTMQPFDPLLLTVAYTRELDKTTTPAAKASTGKTPGFTSNVDSWMASVSYSPREQMSFFSTFTYSQANNFDDFSTIGLPMGSDFTRYDAEMGVTLKPNKSVTLEPHYVYSSYDTSYASAEAGDYNAHAVWLDVTLAWY